MAAFTLDSQDTISVTLNVPFDASFTDLQIWATRKVREADVPGYYALAKTVSNINVSEGAAKPNITFEELKTENSRQIYLRVLGVKADGTVESLNSQTSLKVTRSNTVSHEVPVLIILYPVGAQVPFGFGAYEVSVENDGPAKIFASFDAKADHMIIPSGETRTLTSPGVRGAVVGRRVFLRAAATSGGTVRVRAKRQDAEYL